MVQGRVHAGNDVNRSVREAVASRHWSPTLTKPQARSSFRELVEKTQPPKSEPTGGKPGLRSPEQELDALVDALSERDRQEGSPIRREDPIQGLRELAIKELIPIFVELMEKYADPGISMQMDASNFLEGGREIKFEFGVADHRTQLHGTVTTEAIAFHETRYSPDVQGELVSGPMLRLRGLTGEVFRNFICERLTLLLRTAVRRR
jgi:hypothetical protein